MLLVIERIQFLSFQSIRLIVCLRGTTGLIAVNAVETLLGMKEFKMFLCFIPRLSSARRLLKGIPQQFLFNQRGFLKSF